MAAHRPGTPAPICDGVVGPDHPGPGQGLILGQEAGGVELAPPQCPVGSWVYALMISSTVFARLAGQERLRFSSLTGARDSSESEAWFFFIRRLEGLFSGPLRRSASLESGTDGAGPPPPVGSSPVKARLAPPASSGASTATGVSIVGTAATFSVQERCRTSPG